jgi:hypothetical protein
VHFDGLVNCFFLSEYFLKLRKQGCGVPVKRETRSSWTGLLSWPNAMNANSTLPGTDISDIPVSELPTVYRTYTVKDFLIGLAICLGVLL